VVIGSGAGGATAALVLARAGWEVTVLEKGRSFFRGLGSADGLELPLFGGDEIRRRRHFPGSDPLAEPRTLRSRGAAERGEEAATSENANTLPATVGGGTTHWDGKVPRFFRMDFEMRSRFGPVPDADVADWPLGYDDLAPYYEAVEAILGVAGDLAATPDFVLREAPRGPYPMPPGPPMYAGLLFQEGAARLGYRVHPFPEAINSQPYDGRPACHNCGYCAGFGCPINARGGAAVSFLHRALRAGARLVTRAMATRIATRPDGRASHVEYLASDRRVPSRIEAEVVVLAASAVESARLALLSASPAHPDGLGNRTGRVGRTVCFHASTFAVGVMPQRLHAHRGRSASHVMMEPCLPASPWTRLAGVPYLRGGVVEVGGSAYLIDEALVYDALPWVRRSRHKEWMRSSPLRDRLLGTQMLGEDLPVWGNRVDLDPKVRDVYGLPVARISYSPHRHDWLASLRWGRELRRCLLAAGAEHALFYPAALGWSSDAVASNTRHQSGTLRMGSDPASSVADPFGRLHDAENVVVCDSSLFPTSGAFNPTLTLMAVAMRNATALAHGEAQARRGPPPGVAASA
jgi:choline dehydrogenase-like flavoprotein